MREITLTNGGVTRVDDEDFESLAGQEWRAHWRYQGGVRVGVSGVVSGSSRGGLVLLHRLIAGAIDGQVVDHIDGDPTNNTRANLRLCSHAENMRNRAPNFNSKSGRKGVYVAHEAGKATKYRARIQIEGRRVNLGRFNSPEDAAQAYARAAKKYHGEFARTA